ncbi:hypothetical protein LZ31DRAFT_555061 [Colletotrichum somersetense]|nr:hypothetical protein LZ31DRAFT_555061 [Colletotrichum somersetense]
MQRIWLTHSRPVFHTRKWVASQCNASKTRDTTSTPLALSGQRPENTTHPDPKDPPRATPTPLNRHITAPRLGDKSQVVQTAPDVAEHTRTQNPTVAGPRK